MIIDLKRFFMGDEPEKIVEYSFDMSTVEIDGFKPFVTPVLVRAVLKSLGDSVQLEAYLDFDYSMPCNRCMEEVTTHRDMHVSHRIVKELNDDDDDSYILVKDSLDLDELFYSDILLENPVKYLCSEDCRGICPVCGINLNVNTCDCSKAQVDPRLEVLSALLNSGADD